MSEIRQFLNNSNTYFPQELRIMELDKNKIEAHKGVKIGNKTYVCFYYKEKIYGFY